MHKDKTEPVGWLKLVQERACKAFKLPLLGTSQMQSVQSVVLDLSRHPGCGPVP